MRIYDSPCRDCGVDTTPLEGPQEYFMVDNETWATAGMKPDGGFLCIGCLEERLGRLLTPQDFPDIPVNDPDFLPRPTVRLLSRLGVM